MGPLGAALLTLQQQPSQQAAQTTSDHTSNSFQDSNSRLKQLARQQLEAYHIPAATANVINLSGAGDTLTGAFTATLIRGASAEEALAVGVAAAKVSVECKHNVPGPADGMVYDKLWDHAQRLLQRKQTWHFPVSAAL